MQRQSSGWPPVFLLLATALLFGCAATPALPQSIEPHIFFSDLDSGPSSGGQDNRGAIVTLYGNRFGPVRGSSRVTIAGAEVPAYLYWSDTKIAIQPGPGAVSGDIVVSTSAGSSNPLPFTIRDGSIFFVSPSGNDSANGSFDSPFLTVRKCKNTLKPGDICYVLNGVRESARENYSGVLVLTDGGLPGRPKALIAYPGAHVLIGDPVNGAAPNAIQVPSLNLQVNHWVIAGLRLAGRDSALTLGITGAANYWKVVGNDMTCPGGSGARACVDGSRNTFIRLLGNEVHQAGCGPAVPCPATRPRSTITSSGTTVTASLNLYPLQPGDSILAAGQVRKVLSVSGATAVVADPFLPELTEPTEFTFRSSLPTKLYHSVYFSNGHDFEFAWNHIHNNTACRGIQFHSTPQSGGIPTPPQPSTSTVPGGSLPERTYKLRASYTQFAAQMNPAYRETAASQELSVTVPAGRLLVVQPPPRNELTTGWNLYAGQDSVSRQTPDPLAADAAWTEPDSGLRSGGPAPPSSGNASSSGFNTYNLSIHDNVIHDIVCDGINLATVDPSKGPVRVFNNLIYRAGRGPDPPPDTANYACIYVAGTTNNGTNGSGDIEIFNNTLYDCGARGLRGSSGAIVRGAPSPNLRVQLRNNIVSLAPGEDYLVIPPGGEGLLYGANNIWYGADPSVVNSIPGLTRNLYADPRFVDPAASDFHLLSDSPAIGSGAPAQLDRDTAGTARSPQTPSIGAFENASFYIVNAASGLTQPLSPGAFIHILGTSLGLDTETHAADGLPVDELEHVRVRLNDIPAKLLSVAPNRIRAFVPWTLPANAPARVDIVRGPFSHSTSFPTASAAPAVYRVSPDSSHAALLNADGSLNSPSNPADPGSVVTFYATGFGLTETPVADGAVHAGDPSLGPQSPVAVRVAGLPATIVDRGLTFGFVALLQIKALLPDSLPPGVSIPLELLIDGVASTPVTLAIR